VITIQPLDANDTARKQLDALQASLQLLLTVPESKGRVFTSGVFGPGIDAFARLYVLVEHSLRELRRIYARDLGLPLPTADEVITTRWWRDPATGLSDVSSAFPAIAQAFAGSSGIDALQLKSLPDSLTKLANALAQGDGLAVVECKASNVRISSSSGEQGSVFLWLIFGYRGRKFAVLYLSEHPNDVPAPGAGPQ
jgi:hypothetical protein